MAAVDRAEGRTAAGTGAVIRAAVSLPDELVRTSPLLRDRTTAEFVDGRIRGRQVRSLGAIVLAVTPVRLGAAEGGQAVAEALNRDGLGMLTFSPAADALRRRLAFLHREVAAPWPAVDDAALLGRWQQWLAPELQRLAEGESVGRLDLLDAVRRLLPWPEAGRLEELAPAELPVPSGRRVRVRYPGVGEGGPPVVEVKLQECFGLAVSPRIVGVPVLFHLLSPAGRPVAVTDDLASFWSGAYAQVRAEMRGRYPRHPWPEDPWTSPATRGTKHPRGSRGG
ncbi:ATP-dependent helicase C-terminal domain-containing protein [Nocardioides alcanivorans]|uniref:ATP-dependent helicase C-terminal domain-containing protein n=1 Tax=Nocardioides alcanivorans TaxID=2897352 RepID=UPI001F3D4434|nr:ATP-dependent helicase C-terminal domain-containing protein [Nocardioides alcanivorans]